MHIDSNFLKNTYFQGNIPATRAQRVLVQLIQDVHVSTETKIVKVRLTSFMKMIVVSIYIIPIIFYLLLNKSNNAINSLRNIRVYHISLSTAFKSCIRQFFFAEINKVEFVIGD